MIDVINRDGVQTRIIICWLENHVKYLFTGNGDLSVSLVFQHSNMRMELH